MEGKESKEEEEKEKEDVKKRVRTWNGREKMEGWMREGRKGERRGILYRFEDREKSEEMKLKGRWKDR